MAFLDGDLLVFLWTSATIILRSKARILQNTRQIPMKYELQELSETQLTQAQRDYFKPIDAQLAALNYRPELTFRAANYGKNLMRRYSNPADPASCEVVVVEIKAKAGNVEAVRNANVVSFTTRLADAKRLHTRNMPLKSVMDQSPHVIMQECLNTTDFAALKRKHDARAAQLGPALSPTHGADEIFAEMHREHERFVDHQLAQGTCERTPDGTACRITNKVANRGIVNFFNPFAKRMSLVQLLFTALIGAVVPLAGVLRVAPALTLGGPLSSFALFSAPVLAVASCYALAGAVIGLVSGRSSFTWIMIVTYIPVHLVAGWALGWFPYSTVAHLAAHYADQAVQRRKLVLQN